MRKIFVIPFLSLFLLLSFNHIVYAADDGYLGNKEYYLNFANSTVSSGININSSLDYYITCDARYIPCIYWKSATYVMTTFYDTFNNVLVSKSNVDYTVRGIYHTFNVDKQVDIKNVDIVDVMSNYSVTGFKADYNNYSSSNMYLFANYDDVNSFVSTGNVDYILNYDTINTNSDLLMPLVNKVSYNGFDLIFNIPAMYRSNFEKVDANTVSTLPLLAKYRVNYRFRNGGLHTTEYSDIKLNKQYAFDMLENNLGSFPYRNTIIDNDIITYQVIVDKSYLLNSVSFSDDYVVESIELDLYWSSDTLHIPLHNFIKYDFNKNIYYDAGVDVIDPEQQKPIIDDNVNTNNNWVIPNDSGTTEVNGLLDIIANGFGLFGNNGFFSMLAKTFSFIPLPIITAIAFGVALTWLIIIYKLIRG